MHNDRFLHSHGFILKKGRQLLATLCLGAALTLSPAVYAQDSSALPDFLTQENGDSSSSDQSPPLFADDAGTNDGAQPPGLAPLPPGPGNGDDDFFSDGDFDFEKSPNQLQEEIRSEAFDAALRGLLPLRPEEIRMLLERFDRTQEAVEVPIYPEPKPEFVVNTIPMDPGTKPLVVKTALGNVTTLNFIDTTGQPWPIERMAWAGDFDIIETELDDDDYENTLRIMPRSEYARGNISIDLLDLKTPIIMIIETDRDSIHYRYDAIVPDFGPFAKTPLIQQGITLAAGRPDISSILQGIIPGAAQRMTVSGADGRTTAYSLNGMTYLRTPLTLLSPGWSQSVSSADGMRVYEIQNTPIVLLSERGKMVRASLSERENLLEE